MNVEKAKTSRAEPQFERKQYAGVQEFFAIKRMLDKSSLARTDEEFVRRMVATANRIALEYGLNQYFERIYKKKADDFMLPILERLEKKTYLEYNNEIEHNYNDRIKPNENFDNE